MFSDANVFFNLENHKSHYNMQTKSTYIYEVFKNVSSLINH